MGICIICGKEFEAKRSDAQLCSPTCRQRAKRKGLKLRGQTDGFKGIMPPIAENMGDSHHPAAYDPLRASEVVLLNGLLFFDNQGRTAGALPSPVAPIKSFRDYMDLIKTGNYDRTTVTKQVNEDKKLNSNQKSMIHSKLQ